MIPPQSRPPKALTLDAGMTLLLPAEAVDRTYLRHAQELGLKLEEAAFRSAFERSWKTLFLDRPEDTLVTDEERERRFWRELTTAVAAPFPALTARHEAWHAALVHHFDQAAAWSPAPGAEKLLEACAAREIPVAIVSNWHSGLHRVLEGLGWTKRFAAVVLSAEAGARKPHAAPFLEAWRRLGVAPSPELWHVGDHPLEDVEAARRLGARGLLLDARQSRPSTDILPSLGHLAHILAPPPGKIFH